VKQAIQFIYNQLPKHAEEGNYSQIVSTEQLESDLLSIYPDYKGTASFIIQFTEKMFISFSLLDTSHLASNEWRFVSFPAYLFSQSVLLTWCDSNQSWFPESFWYPEQPETVKNKQRKILNELETRRVELHKEQTAPPIRFVHVAWAFIKLDGDFLLFHREDAHRSDAPNFVPIGGKLHTFDLNDLTQESALVAIQQPANNLTNCGLLKTIIREIEEETELLPNIDYQHKEILELAPYRKVEGAGSKHAYTEYDFKCFHISLTQHGFFKIHNKIRTSNSFSTFTASEMAKGSSAKGEKAYLSAINSHFSYNDEDVTDWLLKIPESYIDQYQVTKDKDTIVFPYEIKQSLRLGKTGKEQTIAHNLNEGEKNWLLALAWHAKNLKFETTAEEILLLPHGWITFYDPASVDVIRSLSEKLGTLGFSNIEWGDENQCRLSMTPDTVFFNEDLYSCELSVNKQGFEYSLVISCNSITLPIGKTKRQCVEIKTTENIFDKLKELKNNQELNTYTNESLAKQMRRIEPDVQKIGLRKILRISNNLYKFSCL